MLKLTLDTNCIINLLGNSPTATSVDELADLMRHALAGAVNIVVTTTLSRDLERDANDDRRRDMLQKAQMFPTVPGLFRLDASRLGQDRLASEEQVHMAEEIRRTVFRTLTASDRRYANKIADVDHLVAHKINARDIFVTDDTDILRRTIELRDEFAIQVMTPKQAVETVSRFTNAALVASDLAQDFAVLSRLLVSKLVEDDPKNWTQENEAQYQQIRARLIRSWPRLTDRFDRFRIAQLGLNVDGTTRYRTADYHQALRDRGSIRRFFDQETGEAALDQLLEYMVDRGGTAPAVWIQRVASEYRTMLDEFATSLSPPLV